ncbi:MAG: uroporphyrinogen-III synthase [Caldilineaceae bacterium]|nr:uroporphyrinogen-III synthase [Caldilineaceae bacterium]HRJ40661.1 uroporphyrinogen-III synthase [Caldilineaceae bacterium]
MAQNPPLQGLSIVNTRANHQAEPLTTALLMQGASVLHYPAIAIAPPADTSALDAALTDALADVFDWLVITSANTVESLAQRLEIGASPGLATGHLRVAAIGTATAEAAERRLGVQVSVVPDEQIAESLANALAVQPGQRILLPQSEITHPLLAEALQAAGADVTQVTAYRTLIGQGGDPVPQLFWEGRIDAVTFTSPSTVHNFLKRLKAAGGNPGMLVDVAVACIGPQTAAAAASHSLPRPLQPDQSTLPALVQTLVRHFQERQG